MQSVNEILIALLALRDIDREIRKLRIDRERYPKEVVELELRKNALSAELDVFHNDLKSLQVARSTLEKDVEANMEGIRKYESQLLQVKENDAYKALQSEIAGLKAKNSALEDAILEKMEKLDQAQSLVDAKKQELKSKEDVFSAKQEECNGKIKELDGHIETWGKERNEKLKDIDPGILRKYEQILSHTKDQAIVPIVNEKCGGCHMRLNPQLIDATLANKELQLCPTCSRILFSTNSVGESIQ